MADILVWMEQTPISLWVRESGTLWAYPTVLFLHTAGLGLLVGMNAVLDARILGVAGETPLEPFEKLYPLMWAGFWVNAISGVVLLMAAATTKLTNPLFYLKLLLISAAVVLLKRIRRRAFGPAAASCRGLAAVSLACWSGAIVAGRLLAYIGGNGANP